MAVPTGEMNANIVKGKLKNLMQAVGVNYLSASLCLKISETKSPDYMKICESIVRMLHTIHEDKWVSIEMFKSSPPQPLEEVKQAPPQEGDQTSIDISEIDATPKPSEVEKPAE